MASSNFTLLLLAFSLLAVSAAARPCKTLFFITSTSYYHIPITTTSQNPNPNFLLPNPSISPRFLTFSFSSISFRDGSSKFGLNRPSIFFRRSDPILLRGPDPIFYDRDDAVEEVEEELESRSSPSMMIPVEFYSSVTSSVRDRSKDIMRVVGALLFGVGCGALTAATMYLIWSLFWPNRFDFEDSEDDSDDDVSPKKMGYVAIPTKVVDDELKKAAAPAKEVV